MRTITAATRFSNRRPGLWVALLWVAIIPSRFTLAQPSSVTAGQQSDATSSVASLTVEESTADLATLGEQSRRLLQVLLVLGAVVGLWFIWSHVLPALRFLERFQLWTVTANNQVNHIPPCSRRLATVRWILSCTVSCPTWIAARPRSTNSMWRRIAS